MTPNEKPVIPDDRNVPEKNRNFFVTVLVPETTPIVRLDFLGNAKRKEDQTMKKRLMLMGTAATLMVLLIALGAQAGPFGYGHRGHGMGSIMGLKVFLDLKLTDAQQADLMNVINKYEGQMEGLRGEMREAGRNVSAVLQSPVFDEQEARKAFRAASAVREELFILRAKMVAEMRGVLTPEQQEMLKERRAQGLERLRQGVAALPEVPSE